MPEWTDEIKEKVYKAYEAANPTPETSTEIVKDIADDLGEGYTSNGVRSVLVRAEKYIKKAPATSTTSKSDGSKRVSKADSVNALTEAIEALGIEADTDIIGKLTGKAAIYFTGVIEKATEEE